MSAYKARLLCWVPSVLFLLLLTSCYHPPFNNFKPFNGLPPGEQRTAIRPYFGNERTLISELASQDIQYIHYGETRTLIVPTDRYFLLGTAKFNTLCYPGLVNIIQLIKKYPDSTLYVAGFTDNIGTKFAKNKLTQARAEAMITFLWAYGIPAKLLHAEGYGDKYSVADNRLIHGSAQNRRLEIQWFSNHTPHLCCPVEK